MLQETIAGLLHRPFLQGCRALPAMTHLGLPTMAMRPSLALQIGLGRRRVVEESANSSPAWAVVLSRRSAFVGPTNVGVNLFKHPQGGHTGLHISASALSGVMNQGNYITLMSAIHGGFPPVPSCWASAASSASQLRRNEAAWNSVVVRKQVNK